VYGSPRTWYAQHNELAGGQTVAALGPYPSRGEYENCFTLETPKGEFIQLTLQLPSTLLAQLSVRAARHAQRSRADYTSRKARETRLRKLGV